MAGAKLLGRSIHELYAPTALIPALGAYISSAEEVTSVLCWKNLAGVLSADRSHSLGAVWTVKSVDSLEHICAPRPISNRPGAPRPISNRPGARNKEGSSGGLQCVD